MKPLPFSISAVVLAVTIVPIDFGFSTHDLFVKPAFAQSQADVAERVREIQTALKHFGFYRGRVDGVMGPGTISGLNKFAVEAKAKGIIKSKGAITASDIDVLLTQYERSVEKTNKARTQTANSGSDSGSRNGGGASASESRSASSGATQSAAQAGSGADAIEQSRESSWGGSYSGGGGGPSASAGGGASTGISASLGN